MMAERAATGSIAELREIAVEQLDLVAFHACLSAEQGLVNADAGMSYNCRRATAHLRLAIDALQMLHKRQTSERENAS